MFFTYSGGGLYAVNDKIDAKVEALTPKTLRARINKIIA